MGFIVFCIHSPGENTMISPRSRFLDMVRHVPGAEPVVSPFLPKPELLEKTLRHLHLPVGQDAVENEIRLARALHYEPMFMTDLAGLIFPQAAPAQNEDDIRRLIATCQRVEERAPEIHRFYREWRERAGDEGVIVIGHPQVTWLSSQISQQDMVFFESDYPAAYRACTEAILQAALQVFEIAMQEGIDFMSEGGYGLEMVSPGWYEKYDLRYIPQLTAWTHAHGGLFWYHNCGRTRELIRRGHFNALGADLIETISPPPEGNNDLGEARGLLDPAICTKGNLSLILLRDGSVEEVKEATRQMVRAVQGYAHIYSTADAVFAETPAENFVAFLRTARDEAERLL
jgi:hypothetical protein